MGIYVFLLYCMELKRNLCDLLEVVQTSYGIRFGNKH